MIGGLVRAAAGRLRRARYRNSLSAPYVSGDLFRSLCDVALDLTSPAVRRQFEQSHRHARAIFVKTDLLPEFLAEFAAGATACRVLITGNSDLEVHEVPGGLPTGLRRWFAQNAHLADRLVRPLPIGLENHALGRNGRLSLFRTCSDQELSEKRLRMFAGFGTTTPERQGLQGQLAESPLVDVAQERVAPRIFQRALRGYRFVIAPRGNGVDTHRFWESLYADAIPITRRSSWSRAIAAGGVPCIEVDAWTDVLSWTPAHLAHLSGTFTARLSSAPWLWADYWRAEIAAS